jgi:putative transposase
MSRVLRKGQIRKPKGNVSLLTYKVKHYTDLSVELEAARNIADYAINAKTTKDLSTKFVKQFGLPSEISNQIMRKYGNNRETKAVKHAVLVAPGRVIDFDLKTKIATIECCDFKLSVQTFFGNNVTAIKSAEISEDYIHFQVSINNAIAQTVSGFLGIDRNATGFLAVCADSQNGNVLKLGKKADHIRKKFKKKRAALQKNKKYNHLKKIANREANIMRDMNHKMSKKIVIYAVQNNVSIKLENLKGISRKLIAKQFGANYNAMLSNWTFYELESFVKYKARLYGVKVYYVNPYMTSQDCAKCGSKGTRKGKTFKCNNCQHSDHADVNAAFNIAARRSTGQIV